MAVSLLLTCHSNNRAPISSANPTCVGELRLMNGDSGDDSAVRRLYFGHDLTIGRDRTKCQWVLTDPYLSAAHLRIYTIAFDNEEDDQVGYLVYAEDLSRNGTFWNDSLIGKGSGGFLLCHEDRLRLSCETAFCFKSLGSQSAKDHFDLQQETEMTHFRHDFVVTDRLLGSGAFGQVFMAIEQHRRTQVACKVIDLRKLKQSKSKHFPFHPGSPKVKVVYQSSQSRTLKLRAAELQREDQRAKQLNACHREVDILSQLSHPNIIGLDKVYITNNTIYIFQELISAGDLFSYLESKKGRLLEVEAAVIVRQVLVAVQFLHDQNIVHRDLKPENILMTNLSTGCRVAITDFGTARRLESLHRMTSVVGSEHYAAPEVKMVDSRNGNTKIGYTKSADMWSIGTITVVLLTGSSAFENPSTGSYSPVLARTCNLKFLQRSRAWALIRSRPQDFITKLLTLDEKQRMTAQEALEHTWFSNELHKVDFENLYQRTVKNWHPRVVKNPVIESVGSSVARDHSTPSHGPIGRKRARQESQPIEPHYRPFPHNMHMPFWPKRKLSRHKMSDEVKVAIAEVWKSKPETTRHSTSSQFLPNDRSHSKMPSHTNQVALRQKLSPKTSRVQPAAFGSLSLSLPPKSLSAPYLPEKLPKTPLHERTNFASSSVRRLHERLGNSTSLDAKLNAPLQRSTAISNSNEAMEDGDSDTGAANMTSPIGKKRKLSQAEDAVVAVDSTLATCSRE